MLKFWPFKKEYLVAAAAVILVLICYQLAFKQTIQAWQLNRQLNSQLLQANELSYQPGYLERKNINLDKIIDHYKADSADFRSNILNTIALEAEKNKVKLTAVPVQQAFYHMNRLIIQKLNFEGDFFALNSFLNHLQTLGGIGTVRSVNFKLVQSRVNNIETKKLILEIYLEITTK